VANRNDALFFKVVQLVLPLPGGGLGVSLRIRGQHGKWGFLTVGDFRVSLPVPVLGPELG